MSQPRLDEADDAFVRRLRLTADLPRDAGDAIAEIPRRVEAFNRGEDIVSRGNGRGHCTVILEGWVCSNKFTAAGKRQITGLYFPGMIPDLQGLFTPTLDHSVTALTPVRAATIPHEALRKAMEDHPAVAHALWKETLVEAAIGREWEVNLGARPGAQRIAHVLCELAVRLDRFGLAERNGDAVTFEWPLTQAELSDIVGLSTVHVNRSLMSLRGLVEVLDQVKVRDLPRLAAYAGFDADYLSTELPPREVSSGQP